MKDHQELIKRLRGCGRKLQPDINYDAADALENSVPVSDLMALINHINNKTVGGINGHIVDGRLLEIGKITEELETLIKRVNNE